MTERYDPVDVVTPPADPAREDARHASEQYLSGEMVDLELSDEAIAAATADVPVLGRTRSGWPAGGGWRIPR